MLNNKNKNLVAHMPDYLIGQQLLGDDNIDSKDKMEWPYQAQETDYFQQSKKLCKDHGGWKELGTYRNEKDNRST